MAEPIAKRARTKAQSEPLVTVASVTAFVAAVLGLIVSFGVPLTEDQQTAVMSLAAVAAPVAVAAWARRKVTPSVGDAR